MTEHEVGPALPLGVVLVGLGCLVGAWLVRRIDSAWVVLMGLGIVLAAWIAR